MIRLFSFGLLGLMLSQSVFGDSNILPKGMTGSMIDMDIPQNVEHVVPAGTAGIFFEAKCFGRNNRGTSNPISPRGKIVNTINAGSHGSATVEFRGNFPGKTVISTVPGIDAAKSFYQNSCNGYCLENPSHCNRSCETFQSCFDSSGESFSWEPVVTQDGFVSHVQSSASFLSSANQKVKDKWNDEIRAKLSDQYDHIIRSNGTSSKKCGDSASEKYVSKLDGLAQELCKVDSNSNKDTCRMKALCTFSCGIIRTNPLDTGVTEDYNLIKSLMNPEMYGYSSSCVSSNCSNYINKINKLMNSLSNASSVGQCARMCANKLLSGKGPSGEANYYRIALKATNAGGCKIDGGSGTLKYCNQGLVVGTTSKIKSTINSNSSVSVSAVQSETGRNTPIQYYGYNGKMNSNVYSTNVRAAQGEDGIPFIRVTADYPGQDGHCGGFHSPLMLFFGYKHPSYINKSDFMKRFEDGTVTYWPEKNHLGYFLAKLDVKNPKKGVYSSAQLFGDNTMNFNGFDFLREYDKNNDNKIDRNDKIWSRLVLWKDKNSDGHSTPDELVRLSDKGIFEISLEVDNTYSVTIGHRAAHKGKSMFRYRKDGKIAIGEVTDVFFADVN